jgi:lipoprotein-releasing system ATP-binding protein
MPDSSPVLQGTAIEKEFRLGPEQLQVLNGVDITIQPGEMVAILGPSGSGKSTLLHILAGLDRPTRGDVTIAGKPLSRLNDEALAAYRNRNVGLIFQFHHLLPEFTVLENVMMPCLIAGDTAGAARQKAEQALAEIDFTSRLRHRPAELSGGEKQKAATARALVTNPQVVLADEPTGNLDSHSAQTLMDLFQDLNARKRVTMVIVSHNERFAQRAHRRFYLDDGLLKETT